MNGLKIIGLNIFINKKGGDFMYLIETFNENEDDKLIDIKNGGIYEDMIECELAIHNIFESLYEIDNNEIQGIITESIGDKLKSFGTKIMRGLETIKNFLKKY